MVSPHFYPEKKAGIDYGKRGKWILSMFWDLCAAPHPVCPYFSVISFKKSPLLDVKKTEKSEVKSKKKHIVFPDPIVTSWLRNIYPISLLSPSAEKRNQ